MSTPVISAHAERADVAFVLEGGRANGDFVSSRKGDHGPRARIAGRASHAGVEPGEGPVGDPRGGAQGPCAPRAQRALAGVTVNVGAIRGGTRPNIAADASPGSTRVASAGPRRRRRRRCVHRRVLDGARDDLRRPAHGPLLADGAAGYGIWWGRWSALAADSGFLLKDAATGGASDANTTSGLGVPRSTGSARSAGTIMPSGVP
ncbi:MAG: hypothetical protein R3C32_08195 [Chloroflexota bacterium]